MSIYTIQITKAAIRQLDKLPNDIAEPLLDTISKLAANPRPHGYKKLKGRNGYRVRHGNYRIIYEIFDKILIIDILAVAHRKDIYE